MQIVRLFDSLRIKLAMFTLQLGILSNQAKDHDTVFQAAWAQSKRLGFLFAAFSSSGNPWHYEIHQVVFLRLLRLLHRIKPGYIPTVTVVNEDIVTHLARSKLPTIIITIHSPVDVVLSRILQERAIQSSALAANRRTAAEKAEILGCNGTPDFIARTKNALLQIRGRLRRNKMVQLCVDFKGHNSTDPQYFISSAIFRITKFMKLNIVFADTLVTRDGDIEVHLHVHDVAETASPHDIASSFLHWLKTARGHTRNWTIAPTEPA